MMHKQMQEIAGSGQQASPRIGWAPRKGWAPTATNSPARRLRAFVLTEGAVAREVLYAHPKFYCATPACVVRRLCKEAAVDLRNFSVAEAQLGVCTAVSRTHAEFFKTPAAPRLKRQNWVYIPYYPIPPLRPSLAPAPFKTRASAGMLRIPALVFNIPHPRRPSARPALCRHVSAARRLAHEKSLLSCLVSDAEDASVFLNLARLAAPNGEALQRPLRAPPRDAARREARRVQALERRPLLPAHLLDS